MSYPKKLLRLAPSGIITDIPPWKVPPNKWTNGENVFFRNGAVERIPGSREVHGTFFDSPLEILNVQISGNNYWVYVGDNTQNVINILTHTDITIAGGLTAVADPQKHSLFALNGVPVHNNASDAPMYWDGNVSNDFVALPDWPAGAVCKKMVAYKFHLVALNIDDSGQFPMLLRWSDAADPGTVPTSWTAAPDNDAGDASLSDRPGAIVTAERMRESLLVYKTGSCYSMDFVGGNSVFALRPLFSNIGALTPRAVVDVNGRHVLLMPDDVLIHDGNQYDSIASSLVRRFVFTQLDQSNIDKAFLFFNRTRQEVWLCYPESGNDYPNRAAVFNLRSSDWTFVIFENPVSSMSLGIVNDESESDVWDDDSEAWDTDLSVWNEQLFSTSDSSIVVAEPTVNTLRSINESLAVERSASLKRHDLTLDQPERLKFIRRLHVLAESLTDLEIRVGYKMSAEENIAWKAWQSLTSQVVNVFSLSRYFSFEIRSTGTDVWRIAGVEIEFELRGYH